MVIVDLATKIVPGIEVVFLDTEAHFDETLAMVERCRARYNLNLTVTHPGPRPRRGPAERSGAASSARSSRCAGPLAGKAAWITGVKRSDGPTRADIPVVGYDDSFGLVKVNPLATWTDADIASYWADHNLPGPPPHRHGATSRSAARRPPARWPRARTRGPGAGPGSDKTECGLHV